MKKEEKSVVDSGIVESKAEYEAPKIESVITSGDMEREVHYAGNQFSGPQGA
jgi:hypothetical protein